jgi:hypothetical protein
MWGERHSVSCFRIQGQPSPKKEFSGQCYPALRYLLQILNEFLSAQGPAGMPALANDGQPRFRLPCAEVLLPSCASPVAAPRLRRQILVLLFGAAVTGCAEDLWSDGEVAHAE